MDKTIKTLADIPEKEECVIVKVNGHGGFRHRVMEMGFVKGERVTVLKNAPLADPIEYRIMQSHVSLRRREASHIEVVSTQEVSEDYSNYNGVLSEEVQEKITQKTKTITVALVGNPNCGKTSFFNHATGLREHVGNYSGVTVSSKVGTFYKDGYTINLVDLPGTYSMTEYTPEEVYVRNFLSEQHPDVILNIVDASNLERNLFLTTQLIDLNMRMVMALNMFDELDKKGIQLDVNQLEEMLGFPCAPTNSRTGKGIDHVLNHIISVYEERDEVTKHIHINYGTELENAISTIKPLLSKHQNIAVDFSPRYLILKLLENDSITYSLLEKNIGETAEIRNTVEKCRKEIEEEYHEDIVSIITNLKYGFIRGALKETMTREKEDKKELAYAIDTVLTNKWLGFPIFVFVMWLMFFATFKLGAYPQEWIEMAFTLLGEWLGAITPEGWLRSLLVDGIVGGHSHTDLAEMTVVKDQEGDDVVIVQDGCWGLGIGELKVRF